MNQIQNGCPYQGTAVCYQGQGASPPEPLTGGFTPGPPQGALPLDPAGG